jgi:hypothetical protein
LFLLKDFRCFSFNLLLLTQQARYLLLIKFSLKLVKFELAPYALSTTLFITKDSLLRATVV